MFKDRREKTGHPTHKVFFIFHINSLFTLCKCAMCVCSSRNMQINVRCIDCIAVGDELKVFLKFVDKLNENRRTRSRKIFLL